MPSRRTTVLPALPAGTESTMNHLTFGTQVRRTFSFNVRKMRRLVLSVGTVRASDDDSNDILSHELTASGVDDNVGVRDRHRYRRDHGS